METPPVGEATNLAKMVPVGKSFRMTLHRGFGFNAEVPQQDAAKLPSFSADEAGAAIVAGCRCALSMKVVGRDERIRTSDPHTPSVMRYQAALRPDRKGAYRQAVEAWQAAIRGDRHADRRREGQDGEVAADDFTGLQQTFKVTLGYGR
jgi:hypothetical protein